MKKILVLLFMLNVLAFSQNGYTTAVDTINSAETLQNEGKYGESIIKSTEASSLLDGELVTTLHELMKFRIAAAKNQADTAIANSRKTAVDNDAQFKPQIEEVNVLYVQAGEFNTAGINAGVDFDTALDNYNKALGAYNNVALNINKITKGYLDRESAVAKKMIDNVRTMYETALKNGAIVKDDATDKLVKTAISEADGALVSYNFALVKQKTDGAVTLIENANKSLVDAKNNAKKIVDEVIAIYDTAVKNNTIAKGDENDIKVSAVLASANKNLDSNNITSALDNANEAKKMIEQINASNALLMAENKKLIEDTKKRRDDFIQASTIIIDGKDDVEIVTLITESEDALNKNNQKNSKDKIVEANNKLNEVELKKIAPRDGDIIPGGVDEVANREGELNLIENETNSGAKITVLPQYYVVVRRVPLTDALWRIAARSYIYGDALEWTKIYEANRRLLRDPRNPDLILPGQRLLIPSIRGEKREGTYINDREYITIEEALNNTTTDTTTATNENTTPAATNTTDDPTMR